METAFRAIEMRTKPRYPILQRCCVHSAQAAFPIILYCIGYNISATGIAVTLPVRLDKGTMLTIEAWDLPRACPLQVRVVHLKQVKLFWFTGCELTKRLSDAELRIWQSGSTDWLDDHK
jgi:hypothetical protein